MDISAPFRTDDRRGDEFLTCDRSVPGVNTKWATTLRRFSLRRYVDEIGKRPRLASLGEPVPA
jgi:hypothetical protein